MSSLVVGFAAHSNTNKLSVQVAHAYLRYIVGKINQSRSLGFDLPDPVIKEVWMNAPCTLIVLVYTGGLANFATGYQGHGHHSLAPIPENFRTSGEFVNCPLGAGNENGDE